MRPLRRSRKSKKVRSRPQKEQSSGSNRRSERLQEKQQQSSERSNEQEDEDHYLSSSESSDHVQQHSPTRGTRASFRQLQLLTSPARPSTNRGQPLTPSTLALRSPTPPRQPSTPPRQPSTSPRQPSTSPRQPSTPRAQPSRNRGQPSTSRAQPSTSRAQPSTSRAQLSTSRAQPSTSQAQPSTSRATPKSRRKGVPKKRRLHSAKYEDMAERIRVLQAYTGLLIPRACFVRLVKEILIQFSYYDHYRVTEGAVECLQESTELYITHYLEDAYMCTLHRKRVTLNVDDMRLVRYIRGVNDPGCKGT